MTVTVDQARHNLNIGDKVELFNTVEAQLVLTVTAVMSSTIFTAVSPIAETAGGIGGYSPVKEIDFYNDFVIFRLLPTFKPVPLSIIRQILADAEPELSRASVTLIDIRTGDAQVKSEVQTYTSSTLYRRHRQQLDELQKPLRQVYDARGRVIPPDLRFTKHANAALYFNVPMVNQWDPAPTTNAYLPAFDFYGFPLNDEVRGPYYSSDIVAYDSAVSNGLRRRENNGTQIYSGPIHDVFGDFAVGARVNNTLIVRKPVQPLLVDHHNTPYKAPLRRG